MSGPKDSMIFKGLPPSNGNGPAGAFGAIRAEGTASWHRQPSERAVPLAGTALERGAIENPEPRSNESVGLDEIFSRLWHRRLTVLCLALIGVAMAALMTLVRTPLYRARTAIRLEGLNNGYPNLGDILPFSTIAANTPGEAYLQNELKILQSETLAKRVAARLGLQTVQSPRHRLGNLLARFEMGRRPPSAEDLRIKAVQQSLTIRSSLKSQVVEVFFDSPDPVLAARAANTVVSEYVAINREARVQRAQDTTEWLAGQTAELKAKLDRGNDELQAFARSSGLLYAANQSSLTEQRVRETQEQLSKAHAERAERQSRYQAAISNSPESLPSTADSGLLREYEGTRAALQRELAQLRSLYTPDHYKIVESEARLSQVESAIKDERQHMIERMREEYESADRLERALANTYRDQTRKLETQTGDAFRYNVLKRELDSTQQLYDSLLQKAKEAGVASALQATSIRVIDVARPPSIPYSPNLPLNCAVGFSGGLLFAVGMILIRERGAYRVERHVDSQMFKIRELGVIPSAKHDPALKTDNRKLLTGIHKDAAVALVTRHDRPSLLTESFRATLTSILFSPDSGRQQRVLAVTSVEPLDGKTTTVCNLGVALTETHARVLLIDADLRRPRLHEIFEHGNDAGLTTVVMSNEPITELKLDALIHPTSVPGLSVLPSGPGASNITPLLYSARMSEFLTRARKEFDYVLIDTPPTALFSDARIIGRLSDSVILVIRAEKTSRRELNAAYLQFIADGSHVLGTILNRWNVNTRRRLYENYSSQ